jgi:hypothetical protein
MQVEVEVEFIVEQKDLVEQVEVGLEKHQDLQLQILEQLILEVAEVDQVEL